MKTSDMIYLDHAAATPIDDAALAAMRPFFSDRFFNPSSPYLPAVEIRREYEAAKAVIASTIGAKPDELVMTAGATESINLAFRAITGHVVTVATEHDAVLQNAKAREHTVVETESNGRVEVSTVIGAIHDTTELVSVSLANNEIGTIQPIADIARAIETVRAQRREAGNRTPLYFHTDASQAYGKIDCKISRLGVDMMTLSAAKIYGPKQVGALFASSSVTLSPIAFGGGQERGLRSGTENVAGVIGFSKAAEIAERKRAGESKRLALLRDKLQTELLDAHPNAIIIGDQKHRLSSHLSIAFPGVDAERLIYLLEEANIFVATGSACAANRGTASHVLTALKLDPEVINSSIRISLGRLNDEQSVTNAAESIITAVKTEKARSKTS